MTPDGSALFTLATQRGPTFWMPEQASSVAGGVDWVFDVITWVSIFFFMSLLMMNRTGAGSEKSNPSIIPLHARAK